MSENLVKFNEYLTFLSEKLQKPVEFVYDLLLRQVYFEGALALFWLIVGVAMLAYTPKLWRWAKKQLDKDPSLEELPFIPFIILLPVGTTLSVIKFTNLLQILINPHWYMIKLAASLVK